MPQKISWLVSIENFLSSHTDMRVKDEAALGSDGVKKTIRS